jgi:hypothetical protein
LASALFANCFGLFWYRLSIPPYPHDWIASSDCRLPFYQVLQHACDAFHYLLPYALASCVCSVQPENFCSSSFCACPASLDYF